MSAESPIFSSDLITDWHSRYSYELSGHIKQWCSKLGLPAEDAKDLLQQTFLRAYQKIHLFNSSVENPINWLKVIALNLARNHRKKIYHPHISTEPRSVLADTSFFHEISDNHPLPEVHFETRETVELVRNALESSILTERQKLVITLHYLSDTTFIDIAQRNSMSLSTVMRASRMAHQQLREHFSSLGLNP